jgi:hypothetical protein
MGIGHEWRVSSYSGANNNCVEVASGSTAVGVRDTKDRATGYLDIPGRSWAAFLVNLQGQSTSTGSDSTP